ncbi:MAG TPA: FtsW/RodA/SpoVE family cell cycle protein, partial [Kiritimatiellia bacterium]|nr:FtsW/RodA/SpoVE family cell cycle protein [Kiritimatiellia bacterium]
AAMYSGGLWGAGLGAGVPQSVPIVTSDFVYAAVAEEIGLVGCTLLLLVYATLFSRGLRAAGAAKTPFERLLCVGLTGSLAVQTILNVAGVTKALPMTGITLPLISHGGSSLITTLLIAGLLTGLSDRK